ncbi:MAG: peptidase C39 family protein [Trueperaceae bacterium]
MSVTAAASVTVRRAERRDLDALVGLEEGFPGDRMSRASLSRMLGRETADVWVAEQAGTVVGDAIVLYRRGFESARLYSMVVHPSRRGRGVARALLAAAEEGSRERGCIVMRLEVREDNAPAIALYQGAGYEVVGRTADYYEDHSTALRMRKRFAKGGATVLGVPYYPQTLEFTCGPSALMMAMRYHGYPVPLERWLELALWREATTVFMLSGHGGCSAHGLAVAALRRGFQTTVVTKDASVPFLDSVRDPEKKDVVRIAHTTFERELRGLGGRVELRDFRDTDVVAALKRGAVPLVLVSGYRLYEERVPHWVVITGFDDDHLYLHDPTVPEHSERADSVHLALRRDVFDAVSRYGRARHRSMVLIERWGKVIRRPPSSG